VQGRDYTFDTILDHVAARCRARGVGIASGDQGLAFAIASGLAQRGIQFREIPFARSNKAEAVAFLRRLMIDGRLVIMPDESEAERDKTRSQLIRYTERATSGGFSYSAPSGQHDDRASLLIVAANACAASLFGPGDPTFDRARLPGKQPGLGPPPEAYTRRAI
jgi:hypothetical protein